MSTSRRLTLAAFAAALLACSHSAAAAFLVTGPNGETGSLTVLLFHNPFAAPGFQFDYEYQLSNIAPIHTATELIATAADKARLHSATGAVAVEMEAALIAPLAAKHNLPFLHIRAISDDCTDEFDPAFLPLALNALAKSLPKILADYHQRSASRD